jgi:hypothetical protein
MVRPLGDEKHHIDHAEHAVECYSDAKCLKANGLGVEKCEFSEGGWFGSVAKCGTPRIVT